MSGFFGDLSPQQEAALVSMKEQFQADDHTLLRFLRARQFNVAQASEMYRNYVQHRKDSGIDKILKTNIPKADEWKAFVPHAFHGFDKEGRPIYIEKTGLIDFDLAYKFMKDEDFMRHHLYQMEHLIDKCKEGSQIAGKVVDNFCTIIDLTGLNMSARKGLKFIRMCAAHDQAYYPERLGKLYIINAPWVFPTFWGICKIWIDPNTIKKIEVLGKNFSKKLLEDIPAEHLPVEYGGKCDCRGDGHCVHVADLSVYRKGGGGLEDDLKHAESVEKVIGTKEIMEVKLQCDDKGGEFHWAFHMASRDVKFSVSVIGGGPELAGLGGSQSQLNLAGGIPTLRRSPSSMLRLAERERYIQEPEVVSSNRGSYASRGACTIIFRWDNSGSRFTTKTVKYRVWQTPYEAEMFDAGTGEVPVSLGRSPSQMAVEQKTDSAPAPAALSRQPSLPRVLSRPVSIRA